MRESKQNRHRMHGQQGEERSDRQVSCESHSPAPQRVPEVGTFVEDQNPRLESIFGEELGASDDDRDEDNGIGEV